MAHLLPENADLAATRALLDEHFELRAGRVRASTVTFYDTFDGRLYEAGVTLRHSGGKLTLTDRATGEPLATAPAGARPEPRLLAPDLPGRLGPIVEMRALLPLARLRERELPLSVLNADQKIVVRLTATTYEGLRGRLTATPVRGYDRELERVDATLTRVLALPPATVPLVDDALAAAGRPPAGTSSKLQLALDPRAPAATAAASVFTRLLAIIDANLPGTLEDVDTEFLHDLRVAVRRTRSLQRQFRSIYPERLQHFRDEFKRLQAVTSDLRDLDVYLLDFPALRALLPDRMQPDLDPLRTLLETRRAKALTATRRALNSRRTRQALADWQAFVTAEAKAASEPAVQRLASKRIAAVYRRMVKLGGAIDDDSPATDLHELRKVGKELRYLLEFFASLYPPEVVRPLVRSLKGLQDQLGRFQDREVQAASLRTLAPEVGDPLTVMAMGVLVDRFVTEEIAARAEFAERFAAFASTEQRALVKEHFA